METESIQDLVLVTGIYKMLHFRGKKKKVFSFFFNIQGVRKDWDLSHQSCFLRRISHKCVPVEEDQPPSSLMTSLETR